MNLTRVVTLLNQGEEAVQEGKTVEDVNKGLIIVIDMEFRQGKERR